jgi:hypothetical protein
MKKMLLFTLLFVVAFASGGVAASKINLVVNGQAVTDVDVKVINGTTYLPLRAVGDLLGVAVTWNNKTKTVSVGEVLNSTGATEETGIYRVGKLTFLNVSAKENTFGWDVRAEIRNNDTKNYEGIGITATFYDGNGKILGTAKGAVMNLKRAETKTVDFLVTEDLTGYAKIKFQIDYTY